MRDNYPAGDNDPIVDWISYDPITGFLEWKKVITGKRGANKTKVGQKVGSVNNKGYLNVTFQGRRLKAHRIAWFLYYKKWPKGQIDHINGNKIDNSIINLRDVSCSENCKNKKIHRNGHLVGTYFCKKSKKWGAQIRIKGKKINLGTFDSKEKAHEYYLKVEKNEKLSR